MSTFVKYCIGGTLAYCFEIILTFFITEKTGIWFMDAFLISLLFGLVFLFYFHKNITFKSKIHYQKRMFIYFLLVAFFIYLGWYLLSYLVNSFINYHYLLKLVVASVPLSLLGYFINRKYIFRVK